MEGKGTGNKKHNWEAYNRQGEFKNSIRNVETKELICMTHGHELRRWRDVHGRWYADAGWRGIKREKWDNCNSIINKIHFFKKITFLKVNGMGIQTQSCLLPN